MLYLRKISCDADNGIDMEIAVKTLKKERLSTTSLEWLEADVIKQEALERQEATALNARNLELWQKLCQLHAGKKCTIVDCNDNDELAGYEIAGMIATRQMPGCDCVINGSVYSVPLNNGFCAFFHEHLEDVGLIAKETASMVFEFEVNDYSPKIARQFPICLSRPDQFNDRFSNHAPLMYKAYAKHRFNEMFEALKHKYQNCMDENGL